MHGVERIGAAALLEEPANVSRVRQRLEALEAQATTCLDDLEGRLRLEVDLARADDELVSPPGQGGEGLPRDQSLAVLGVIGEQLGGRGHEDAKRPSRRHRPRHRAPSGAVSTSTWW